MKRNLRKINIHPLASGFRSEMKVNRKNKKCLGIVLSGLVVIIGTGLLISHKIIADTFIDEVFVLKPNNYFYNEWKDPTLPIRIEFYYFNWTNPEDLMNPSEKPKFQEIGPLVFSEEIHKWNITFHDNNTVSYRNMKTFFLNEKESNTTFDANITTVNVIPLVAADKSRNWNFIYRKGLSVALYRTPYHITRKAEQWIFAGYEDPLLSSTKYLPFVDDIPGLERFAWFYGRNASASYEGDYNIGTGLGNTSLGTTYKWNHRSRSDYDGKCGEIEAPTEFYPQNLKKESIELFFPDFCRRITFDYNGTVTWNGIEAYIFSAGMRFLDNGKYHEENKCLCNRKCLKFGVVDYSKCKFGIPGYLSLPHFRGADAKYRNDVEGMHPNETKHIMRMLINPRTGSVVDLKISVQLNLYLEPNPSISIYQDVPELMIPVFWFMVDISMDTKNLILLNIILRLEIIIQIISCILISSGVVLLIRFLRRSISKKSINEHVEKVNQENSKLLANKACCDQTNEELRGKC